jgi:hypothetical protein
MKHLLTASALALSLATAAAGGLPASERDVLNQLPTTDVAALRAGAADGPTLPSPEREALQRAQASTPKLAELRGGDHDDLSVVAVVLAVVILAIIIF